MSKIRDAYIARMHAEIDQLNSNVYALQEKTNEVKADARENYVSELAKLRRHSSLASEKIVEMRAASEISWNTMVADMNKLYDAFVNAFSYFKTQLHH